MIKKRCCLDSESYKCSQLKILKPQCTVKNTGDLEPHPCDASRARASESTQSTDGRFLSTPRLSREWTCYSSRDEGIKERVDLLASAVWLFECISLLVCYGIC